MNPGAVRARRFFAPHPVWDELHLALPETGWNAIRRSASVHLDLVAIADQRIQVLKAAAPPRPRSGTCGATPMAHASKVKAMPPRGCSVRSAAGRSSGAPPVRSGTFISRRSHALSEASADPRRLHPARAQDALEQSRRCRRKTSASISSAAHAFQHRSHRAQQHVAVVTQLEDQRPRAFPNGMHSHHPASLLAGTGSPFRVQYVRIGPALIGNKTPAAWPVPGANTAREDERVESPFSPQGSTFAVFPSRIGRSKIVPPIPPVPGSVSTE